MVTSPTRTAVTWLTSSRSWNWVVKLTEPWPLVGGGTGAATQTRRALEDYDLPEVRYFLDTFLDSFSLTLDELK